MKYTFIHHLSAKQKFFLFVIAFGLIGLAATLLIRAAEDNSFIEPETSAVSGNATSVQDANAILSLMNRYRRNYFIK